MDTNGNDIQTVEVTSVDPDHVFMEATAKTAAQILCDSYGAHLWTVGWAPGGCLIIKNMSMPQQYGFTIDVPRVASSSEFKRLVYMAGGELLERAGMRRGTWDGEFATHLEGALDKHQPPAFQ